MPFQEDPGHCGHRLGASELRDAHGGVGARGQRRGGEAGPSRWPGPCGATPHLSGALYI